MRSYQGAIRSKNRVVFAAPCTTGTVRPECSRRFEAAGELDEDYIDGGSMAKGVRMAKTSAKPPNFRIRTKASKAYADRARRWIPGGVTANVKYFDPYPIAMKTAKGSRLWDLDGNEYIDYCLSFGPLILGHGHPRVMKAIRDSLRSAGTTMFGTPHELEAAYAEHLLRIFRPNGRIRFTVSGTEATVHAVRVARAYRKRPMIAKFQGHYHGGVDEFLVSHAPTGREGRDLIPVSGSTGTPDLTCLGKIIGGGLPCGAFLGREDILDLADPSVDGFFHSSTFAGYPTAMAAGLATLDELQRDGTMAQLLTTSYHTMVEIGKRIREAHVPAQVLGCGSVFSILFSEASIRNYQDTLTADDKSRRKLDFALLERGVFVKPEKPFYLSTAHDREALTHTFDAFDEILPTLA